MRTILIRLTALCMLAAVGEQLAPEGRLKEGVRLTEGLLAAEMILEMTLSLPAALFG